MIEKKDLDQDSRWIAGIDIGGTNTKFCLVHPDSQELLKGDLETDTRQEPASVIKEIAIAVSELLATTGADQKLHGVGVACPGPLDLERGVVLNAANLRGWCELPIRDQFVRALDCPVTLLNDANAACFGEVMLGAGRGATNAVLFTLGTGIGGGMTVGGRLVEGAYGNGGELGHMIVVPQGRACACGQYGCMEAYAGGRSLVQRAAENNLGTSEAPLTVPEIIKAAESNEAAAEIWADACKALAIGCVNMQHVVEPDVIIFGGGIAAAGDAVLQPVQRYISERYWKLSPNRAELRLASLGTWAGALGAAQWHIHRSP
ncbi:MAG: ROK family protein [Phycisphaerae bacterium]